VVFAGAAILVAAVYTVRTSFALIGQFEPDLLTRGVTFGFAWSLTNHLLIFSAAFLATALIIRLTDGHFVLHYAVLLATLIAGLSFVFDQFVGSAIALSGTPAAVAAFATAVAIVGTWTGLRLRTLAGQGLALASGLDVLFGVPDAGESVRRFTRDAAGVAAAAVTLAWAAGFIDWDFLFLKSGVLIVWLAAFGVLYRHLSSRRSLSAVAVAGACLAPLAVHAAMKPDALALHVLERYAVYNPSFLLTDRILGRGPTTTPFDLYLRAHSGFTDLDIPPVSIDFVNELKTAPAQAKPLIFMFVIDSLRRDYLSPFNEAVTFTPRIQEFAGDSVAFMNAFTHYGGTGLSMPAIWAGSGIVHKQYVQPFGPMNALQKLLDANGYRKVMSHDHITVQLVDQHADDIQLDRGRVEMKFDFCDTVAEIDALLEDRTLLQKPLFAHTRSLNMHVIEVRKSALPPGESYPGFYERYASRVHRIDGCFGRFIDSLKRRNLYDRSLIVLTADHGELMGEDGRWGHSYHLYPPVIQVPLLIHFPKGTPTDSIDPYAVAQTTDIVPTIYSVLGYTPESPNTLAGTSLITGGEAAARARRRTSFVIPASYGPVYAVLRNNGTRLYIADGVNRNDQVYERSPGGAWAKLAVSDSLRSVNRAEIRRYIDEVARIYRVDPRF
jgi:hypothetical protein